MEKNRKTANVNIPICVASVLLCLTMISIHLTSGLYARYTSNASKNDDGRVIAFGELMITEDGDFNENGKLMIVPGVDLKKRSVVDFGGSEALSYVFVEISLSQHWATSDNETFIVNSGNKELMQWTLADEWDYVESEGNTYVFCQEVGPNTPLSADVVGNDGTIAVSEYITESEISSMTDIYIKTSAAVVQAGGFDGPAAAWEAVSNK